MKKRYSLYTIVFVLIIAIAVIVLFFGSVLANYQRNKLTEGKIQEIVQLAEVIDRTTYSSSALYQKNIKETMVEEMAGFSDLRYIRVITEDGGINQSSIKGESGKKITNPNILNLFLAGSVIEADVIFNGEKIRSIIYPGSGGQFIWIGFSLESVEEMCREIVFYGFLIITGCLVMISLTIFLILRISIIVPLKKVIEAFKDARDGGLEPSIDTEPNTEIGELIDSFNEMIKDLKYYQLNLEEAKDVLEVKIDSKAKELKELNENLESKIQERTKELQDKVDELEKFRRLTVGRELKMKKMKKIIEKLKERIEKENK